MVYQITQAGFFILTIAFYFRLIQLFRQALPKTSFSDEKQKRIINIIILSVAGWIVFICAISLAGITGRFDLFPLNVAPVLFIPLITIIAFTLSGVLKEILPHIAEQELIRMQVFRVFVEILLWLLFIEKLLPEQMTFEGRNFDILAGLTAPFIAYLVSKKKLSKTGIIIWNIMCLGLLINIVSVAILSMPTPFQYFKNEPSNTIVTEFPVSLLPGLLVPLAYMLHFLSLRQQFLKR